MRIAASEFESQVQKKFNVVPGSVTYPLSGAGDRSEPPRRTRLALGGGAEDGPAGGAGAGLDYLD